MDGGFTEVERDQTGRVARTTYFYGTKQGSTTRYNYSGDALRESGYESLDSNGELTGRVKVQRDSQGRPIRYDNYTAQGDLTRYTILSYDGVQRSRNRTRRLESKPASTLGYSAEGLLYSQKRHADSTHYFEVEIDPHTGLKQSEKAFTDGSFDHRNVYTYNANGDRIRQDADDRQGKWYAMAEYNQGLVTRMKYELSNGDTKKINLSYDQRDWIKDAKFLHNDHFICNLVVGWCRSTGRKALSISDATS